MVTVGVNVGEWVIEVLRCLSESLPLGTTADLTSIG